MIESQGQKDRDSDREPETSEQETVIESQRQKDRDSDREPGTSEQETERQRQ